MSWLFGIKPQPTPPTDGPEAQEKPGQGRRSAATTSEDGSQFNYSFDSTALERAAKAAKDLEKSANAKQAIELSRLQEVTKQKEYELHQKVSRMLGFY
jgi:ATPase family AAA domain-containing protein 3A/B